MTGGAGFVGANFVHYWLGRYPDDVVVVLDAFLSVRLIAVMSIRFYHVDADHI